MKEDFNYRLEGKDFETIPDKICRLLREAIINGDLKPGQHLAQTELAESMGVSRMPIREALKKLEAEGLVTIEPHRGAIVRQFTIEEIEEIYYLRKIFEKQAVEESVRRMTLEVYNDLEQLVHDMDSTHDIGEFVKLNIAFHELLISCCPYPRLNNFIKQLSTGLPLNTPYIFPKGIGKSKTEHSEILAAVKIKDSQRASELIELHIDRAGLNVLQNLKVKM